MDEYTKENCFASNCVDHAAKANSNLKFRASIYRTDTYYRYIIRS